MVELKNVRFSRDRRVILNDLSFFIGSKERVAVLGGSGAGKTTLLKLLLGLERPDSGEIIIDGEEITSLKEEQLRRIRTKFTIVFQDGALFDSLSVKDNVAFYLHEKTHLSENEIRQRVEEMLDVVGLREAIDEMPEFLSGGMKRRVAIARALIMKEPKMFLYDEPTADLDPVNAEIICKLILRLSRGEKGFLIVTHEIIHALAVAERFMFIENGRLDFDGDKTAFLDPSNSQLSAFVGDFYNEAVYRTPANGSSRNQS
jgi:phospholipid/cholesterol/gamma-HCH transport system ATP-binding protein